MLSGTARQQNMNCGGEMNALVCPYVPGITNNMPVALVCHREKSCLPLCTLQTQK